jgi:hypothetical protein
MITKHFLVNGVLLFRGSLNDKTTGYDKDTKECYRFSIKEPVFKNNKGDKDLKELTGEYDVKDRFTPKWVKEYVNDKKAPEYINFKSNFPLVVRERTDHGDVEIDRSEVISGAKGWLSLTLKSDDNGTTLYSGQFLMIENGTLYNPFEEV